jgi:hypothetical protein
MKGGSSVFGEFLLPHKEHPFWPWFYIFLCKMWAGSLLSNINYFSLSVAFAAVRCLLFVVQLIVFRSAVTQMFRSLPFPRRKFDVRYGLNSAHRVSCPKKVQCCVLYTLTKTTSHRRQNRLLDPVTLDVRLSQAGEQIVLINVSVYRWICVRWCTLNEW